MKRFLLAAAALVAAAAVLLALSLRPRPLVLPPPDDGSVPGVIHIHTTRSDGRGTPDEIAAAASRVGLKFLVFTDHGDGTRPPDAPVYRSGVLCLDGVEISTSGGHYLAIGMSVAPYPLAGSPRDVVEDVKRLGGVGIVAHPDSPKPELAWRDWGVPIDGMEWVNLDTSWRRPLAYGGFRGRIGLIGSLLAYPLRPEATIAGMTGGAGDLYQWEAIARKRRLALVSGADAHANVELTASDPRQNRWALSLPSYESTFRALSLHLRIPRPFSGDAVADAHLVVEALRAGHAFTAIDGLATPASFVFTASNELGTVHEGDELGVGGPVTLDVRSNAPSTFSTTIYRGREPLVRSMGSQAHATVDGDPGVYWVEIKTEGGPRDASRRWIVSNAIYVRANHADPTVSTPADVNASMDLLDAGGGLAWHGEHDAASSAEVSRGELPDARLKYGLGGGAPAGQFAALVIDTPTGLAPYERLAFAIRGDRVGRVSVQMRNAAGGAQALRWQRSVAVEPFERERVLSLDDFEAVGREATSRVNPAEVRSLLFVIDTVNTRPGTAGALTLSKVRLER